MPPRRGSPHGSNGVEHVVVLMMENRSFDHFLSWLPGADGRHDMIYQSTDGNYYPNYPLAPDFQGCGYSDPDHSWEGFLVQHNFGKMDGFLQRPTAPADNPGVTLAKANTFPIGYYTNHRSRPARRKAVPDLPGHRRAGRALHGPGPLLLLVRGRDLPEPLLPARRADRPRPQQLAISSCRRSGTSSRPSPIPRAFPTGGYFFRDLPFLALWGHEVLPVLASVRGWRRRRASGSRSPRRRSSTPWPRATCRTSASSTRRSTPRATAPRPTTTRWRTSGSASASSPTPTTPWPSAGYLDNTVFVVTFDEWGGFYDHVPPPHVIDDTNPANVDHTGDSTTPTDGQLIPDYTQLGFRVPAIVVSNLARPARRPSWPVRAHLDAEADRVHLRAAAADGAGRQRAEPGHVLDNRSATSHVPRGRDPDQQRGTGPGKRRGRRLQRRQRPVRLAAAGPPRPGAGEEARRTRGPAGRRDQAWRGSATSSGRTGGSKPGRPLSRPG